MSATSIPVRLLSSVAVIGRDNEPIYLRGELYKARETQDSPDDAGGASSIVEPEHEEGAAAAADGNDTVAGEASQASSSAASSAAASTKRSTSLFGRIKGAVTPNTSEVINSSGQSSAADKAGGGDDDEDGGDPFGFFSANNASCAHASLASSALAGPAVQMSLTQLVLHASLDRFEERMAGGRGNGAAPRWRTPGSSGANGMWMGRLCRVEERWNVYGYLTNTGVKFMIVVEELYMTRDGKAVSATSSTPGLSGGSAAPTNHREGDLRNIFGHLHELYVRYSMNPFSQLRGAIRSESFEKGIVGMANSFNDLAIEDANGSDLAWM